MAGVAARSLECPPRDGDGHDVPRGDQACAVPQKADLLMRRLLLAPDPLRGPAPPDRPDQVWHLDLIIAALEARNTSPLSSVNDINPDFRCDDGTETVEMRRTS